MKKVSLFIFLAFISAPLCAQGQLLKAGKKAVAETTLKTSIEQSLTQATSAAAKAAARNAAAGALRTSAVPYPDYSYAGSFASYRPYNPYAGSSNEYPDMQLASFYKRVYSQLSDELSSKDIVRSSLYDETLKKNYRALVGEMQGLNYQMATAVRNFLRGNRDTYEMEQINRTMADLSPKIAQFKQQIPSASALRQIEKNMKYYSAAVMRMPFFDETVQSALAYNEKIFNLSPAGDVLKDEDVLAIDDFVLPDQLRLAVVHDEKAVFNFFRNAQQNGFLPAAWKVDVFENTTAFMQAHQSEPYQLVISDRGLDDTFDKLVLNLRHGNDQTPVIAHTAGIDYDTKILYDKGYSAVFPFILEHPLELNLVLKKYFYYAGQGLLPAVEYTAPARKITYP